MKCPWPDKITDQKTIQPQRKGGQKKSMSYDTGPWTCHASQSTVFITKPFYLYPRIIYPFPIAKNCSYLCIKKFCFKIAKCKICNTEEKQHDTSLQVPWLAKENSIIILLLEREEFCLYRIHAVQTENNHICRWTEKKKEGGGDRGWSFCATQPYLWNGNNWCVFPAGWGWISKCSLPWYVQTDATREDGAISVWQNMFVMWQPGSVRCKCTSGAWRSSPPKQTPVRVSTADVLIYR